MIITVDNTSGAKQIHVWVTRVCTDVYRIMFDVSSVILLKWLCIVCTQAKYLAQIIVMGAQVVGRAFARALRQEFAGKYYVQIIDINLLMQMFILYVC